MNKAFKFIISLLIPQLAGGLGSIFTASSVGDWYKTIEKGPLNPPSWVFGPVWTTLFLLIGLSLFLIWTKSEGDKRKLALVVFGIQLFLNVLWSVLFFGSQNPGLALLEILVLWAAILMNLIVFYRLNKTAGWLLLPYLLWVSFAIYLNFSIWRLN